MNLEVTFTRENARDYGRRGENSIMLREIKERLFVENNEGGEGGYFLQDIVTARTNQYYIGAGFIFGMLKLINFLKYNKKLKLLCELIVRVG